MSGSQRSAGAATTPMRALVEATTGLARVRYAFQSHAAPDAAWHVVHVRMEERCSEGYALTIALTSEGADDPAALLDGACTLLIRRDQGERCLHGVVSRISLHGAQHAAGSIEVRVVPALEALRQRIDCRVFQDLTVPQIIDAVLMDGLSLHGRNYEFRLHRSAYPRRAYVVQHRESDLDFIQRLLALEGMWYCFEHERDAERGELLVFLDSNAEARDAQLGDGGSVLPLALEASGDSYWEAVHELKLDRGPAAPRVTVRSVNWSNPPVVDESSAPPEASTRHRYEPHDVAFWGYESERFTRSDVADQAQMRWERLQAGVERLRGRSNVVALAAGQRILIEGAGALDGAWIVRAVEAHGYDSRRGGSGGGGTDFANTFSAQRAEVPVRSRPHAKPRVMGLQLGTVVGPDGKPECPPDGDDIHVDEHGRVRVKMSWDRTTPGTDDATTTCFLRVSQSWGGAGWGTQFLPRIGMEVVIGFVDGDPDQPLVTGCLYNGLARAPFAPHEEKTKSYIRTQSSPGAHGYNELQFDDAAGKELVALRAQRDHREQVLHDQTIDVGRNRTEHVSGSEAVDVRGARIHTVHGSETLRIVDGSGRLLDVSGDETTLIARKRRLTVGDHTSEEHLGGREVRVHGDERLYVEEGAHKSDHISGQYTVIADEHFKVQQGDDQLYIKDAFYVSSRGSVQLKNAGFHLHADAEGNTTIDAGKQLTIRVGSAHIQLKSDGSVLVSGTREVKLAAAASSCAATPTGVEVNGPKSVLSGTALVEVRAPMVTIN